jgi:hypothetical protein
LTWPPNIRTYIKVGGSQSGVVQEGRIFGRGSILETPSHRPVVSLQPAIVVKTLAGWKRGNTHTDPDPRRILSHVHRTWAGIASPIDVP